jgi:hypothetical protein
MMKLSQNTGTDVCFYGGYNQILHRSSGVIGASIGKGIDCQFENFSR